jgi:hypothetical protein
VPSYRPAVARTGTVLAAAALAMASCLPAGTTATATGADVAVWGHGPAT